MPIEHRGHEVLGGLVKCVAHVQPLFVAPYFAEIDDVEVLLNYGFGYDAFEVVLVHRSAEHVLMNTTVEAANVQQCSWQVAKLRSAGAVVGGSEARQDICQHTFFTRASFPLTYFLAPAFILEGAGVHSMNLPAFTP